MAKVAVREVVWWMMRSARLDLTDMVERTGLPRQTLDRFLSGKHQADVSEINLIAKALCVRPVDIVYHSTRGIWQPRGKQ